MNTKFLGDVANVKRSNERQANDLINTSVQDMTSSLGCNTYTYSVLQKALEITMRRGEKTKSDILKRHINKLERKLERGSTNDQRI